MFVLPERLNFIILQSKLCARDYETESQLLIGHHASLVSFLQALIMTRPQQRSLTI